MNEMRWRKICLSLWTKLCQDLLAKNNISYLRVSVCLGPGCGWSGPRVWLSVYHEDTVKVSLGTTILAKPDRTGKGGLQSHSGDCRWTQFLLGWWIEGLSSWLMLAKRPPSVLCQITLSGEQLTNGNSLHQNKWEEPERGSEQEGCHSHS